ncbi:MAG TPA: transketolase C-terminal domain-containing protein, partial [bacterium]|nr:transketolase C-terminal domain-containing protein [bacterium]
MRNAFAEQITELASRDERIMLLSGDIGNRLFNGFKETAPGRFFNCGVAEANMIGVAAGMAMCGARPVVYTIAPFVTTRCLEQIKIDLCRAKLPVVVVGIGAGLSYAELGATHHSCEDIAQLRTLPNMTVVCPADPVEVRLALREAVEYGAPVYLRLGKKGEPDIHAKEPDFKIGRAIPLRQGKDICMIGAGNILPEMIAAADLLEGRGISVSAASFHTVKPLDMEYLEDAFRQHEIVASVEEHSVCGGLGGTVAEWLSEETSIRARLVRCGVPDTFFPDAGDQAYARKYFGIDAESIAEKLERA